MRRGEFFPAQPRASLGSVVTVVSERHDQE
jgi:hypothetical protein